jgi:hypothetical protein
LDQAKHTVIIPRTNLLRRYDDILKGNYKAPDSGSDSNKKPEAGKEGGTDSKAGEEAESDDADEADFINDADTDEVMDLDENAGHDEM